MAGIDLPNGKLILLYMLHQVKNVPSPELMNWAVESLYLDYFSFVEAKEELKRDHLMTEAVRKGETRTAPSGHPLELCDITPEGEIVLMQLLPALPSPVRAYLNSAAPGWSRKAHADASVTANYVPDTDGSYKVRLTLMDGARITADLSLFAPNEDAAQKMCRRWKESTAGIYTSLLASLNPDQRS